MIDNIISTFNNARIYYIIMFVIVYVALILIFAVLKKLLPYIFKIIGVILVQIVTFYYKLSGKCIIHFRSKNNGFMLKVLMFFESVFYILPYCCHCIVVEVKKIIEKQKMKKNLFLYIIIRAVAAILIIVLDINTGFLSHTRYNDITMTWVTDISETFAKVNETDSDISESSEETNETDLYRYLIPQETARYQFVYQQMETFSSNYVEQECSFENSIRIIDGKEYGLFKTSSNMPFYVENPMQYVGTEVIPTEITVSSYLSYTKNNTLREYPYNNLTDKDFTTCWIEGIDDSGINESISFTFSGSTMIDAIDIANGYQVSERSYKRNERVKSCQILTDGKMLGIFDLDYADQNEFGLMNIIKFDTPIEVAYDLTIIITSVDKQECVYTDTAISEITLYQYE